MMCRFRFLFFNGVRLLGVDIEIDLQCIQALFCNLLFLRAVSYVFATELNGD